MKGRWVGLCARCKRWPALMGSRCVTCRIRECSRRTPLVRYAWWRDKESEFAALMLGRYMNDGFGVPPPSVEETLHSLKLLAKVKQYRRMDDVQALFDMVDRARRKNADSSRSEAE